MSMESDIVAAIVTLMRADSDFLTMLGESTALHVEGADDTDATIVRGGLGRCLVRPAAGGNLVVRSLGANARVAYPVELVFEAIGTGGRRMMTRSGLRTAVVSLFGDNGDALLAQVGSQIDRNGLSGSVTIESVAEEAAPDARSARVIASLTVDIWQNVPETV